MQATKTYTREARTPNELPLEVTLVCPNFPSTLRKAMDLIDSPDRIEVSAVSRMVDDDVAIRARMLQIVNSRYYGLSRSVDSPSRMVVLLGPVTVSGMLVAMDLLKLRDSFEEESQACFIRLMKHSAATAFLSRHLCEMIRTSAGGNNKIGHQHVGESFATGMIHDFGRIVLMFNTPSVGRALYADLCEDIAKSDEQIRKTETEFFGCDSDEVGVDFARTLGFPDVAVDVIRYHQSPESIRYDQDAVEARMIRAVCCAHTAATSMGYGFPCEQSEESCLASNCWSELSRLDIPEIAPGALAQKTLELKAYVDEYVNLLIDE